MRRPVLIAKQSRHAKGWLGRIVAFIMARETWPQNQRAIVALEIAEHDHVLDIGCGPGRSIAGLAVRAPRGHVAGVDPSALMADIAVNRNRALVRSGRAEIAISSVNELPYPDRTFDKVLCVHVVYFLDDLATAFQEIGRVLKPGGRLALVFRTSVDAKTVNAFPADVYRFRLLRDVIAPLEAAGFAVERKDELSCEASAMPVLLLARRC